MSDLKAKYDAAFARERELHIEACARETLIVYAAEYLANMIFKDDPRFANIRELAAERNDFLNKYYEQCKETTAAWNAYMAPIHAETAAFLEATDVH